MVKTMINVVIAVSYPHLFLLSTYVHRVGILDARFLYDAG